MSNHYDPDYDDPPTRGSFPVVDRVAIPPPAPVPAAARQEGGEHYTKHAIQPITYILENGLGFCEGNVVKYVTRWRDKGGVEDLRKAKQYLDFLIEQETE